MLLLVTIRNLTYKPIVRRPKETCSYIDAHRIIGRDKDKEEIISVVEF